MSSLIEATYQGDSADAASDYLSLFGTPQLRYASSLQFEELEWQRPAALLSYLACRQGWHSRESLAELLRPDANGPAGRAYLRKLLHRTREVLPKLEFLEIEETRVRWSGGCDVRTFERAVDQNDWQLAVNLQTRPLLYQSGATGQPALDDWFYEERIRLQQRLRFSLMARIEEVQKQHLGDGADLMQRLVELDPLDEYAVQFVLGRARTSLESHAGIVAFQTLQRRFATELGQKPSARSFELYEALKSLDHVGREVALGPQKASPLGGLKASPLRSPGRVERRPIGRESEIARLKELMHRNEVQLITIYGLGGAGKTALARAVFEDFPTGGARYAWVDLLAIDSLHAMLDAVAAAVGMPPRDGAVEDHLAHWLADRTTVVFLDNFEQLTSHANVLHDLLKAARGLRLVVTSREALRLPDEHLFALSGLEHRGEDSPAVKLFERHAARMGHVSGDGERSSIAKLVGHFEGLPLAIELAANWVALLPIPDILSELMSNPALIDAAGGGGASGARNMRSVFNASWRRLDPQEQEALASLSVVKAAMSLETARAVASSDVAMFLRLVNKSLLHRTDDGLFKIHPLLGQFVKEQADAGFLAAADLRHCEYFLKVLSAPPVLTASQFAPQRIATLLPMAEDISKAWRWAVDHNRHDLIDLSLLNLAGLFFSSYRYEEAAELAAYAMAKLPEVHVLATAFAGMYTLACLKLGRMGLAESVAMKSLQTHPARDPAVEARHGSLARLNIALSRIYWFRGDHETALPYAKQALQEASGSDVYTQIMAVEEMAKCSYALGQLDTAEGYLRSNLALAKKYDAVYLEGRTCCLLGFVRDAAGAPQEAISLFECAIYIFRRTADLYQIAYCQRAVSFSYQKSGDFKMQMGAATDALEGFRKAGYHHEEGESLFALGSAQDAAGQPAQAAGTYSNALGASLQINNLPVALPCIAALGAILAQDDRPQGLALMTFAASHPAWRRPDLLLVESKLVTLQASEGELEQARERASRWSFPYVCGMLLAPPAEPARKH